MFIFETIQITKSYFTATQIPNIEGRNYPPELVGSLSDRHPDLSRKRPASLITEQAIEQVFSPTAMYLTNM
jgi:hypothetical protein